MNSLKRAIIYYKKNRVLDKVEKKVLGFKLHEWQREYILNTSKCTSILWEHPERASGKTLAWDLRLLLFVEGEYEIRLSDQHLLDDEPDLPNKRAYRTWHLREIATLYNKLKGAGIKVPKITFRAYSQRILHG